MAQLVIRRIDDDVKERLRRRAARRGRSLEAELRDILRAAAREPQPEAGGLGSRIARRFKSVGFDGELPALPRQPARPAKLGP